jgi:ankyrin repeat protein
MKILFLLLKFKADINASGREGLTALHHAATSGNSVMTKWLLDRGADPGIRASSVRADTPLMVAAQYGHVTTMAKLAGAGANIEDCDVSLVCE